MCKSVKSYVEEGVRYKFDRDKFSEMIDKKRLEKMSSSKKVYRCNIMTELADQLSVSFDSVKSWTYGN
nr:hypothetical protein [Lachnospiraceae bacterium]